MITRVVISLKARLRGSVTFDFEACLIWIVEAVDRVSFLFPTYLESSEETVRRETNDER